MRDIDSAQRQRPNLAPPISILVAVTLLALFVSGGLMAQSPAPVAPASSPSADGAKTDPSSSPAKPGRLLLVLPFDNHTDQPNLDRIGEAIPKALNRRLASAGFMPISRDDRPYALDHLGLPSTFQPSSASANVSLAPPVSVALTPSSVALTPSRTQAFTATVSNTSNISVTWSLNPAVGTISPTGLYTAPATVPSPSTVTITATSMSDPAKSVSADVTISPVVGTTYYLATAVAGGNDSNDGLTPGAPWLTPNHNVNCGDVILAAPSTSYASTNFTTGKWSKVTCNSGNNVAWLKCAIFDACRISTSRAQGMWVDQSYWGVQGWEITTTATDEAGSCFLAEPPWAAPVNINHIIFANDVANGCGATGFATGNNGNASVDYIVIVGNIAYNAAQSDATCNNGIDIYQPIQSDAMPGTHIYLAGNFSFGNFDHNPCAGLTPGDGEGITLDTFDGADSGLPSSYAAQAVVDNNILAANGGRGLLVGTNNDVSGTPPFAHVYFRHNTVWGNNGDLNQTGTSTSDYCGEVLLFATVNTEVFSNLAVTNATNGCGTKQIYAYYVRNSNTTTNHVYQNWGYAASGTNDVVGNSTGFYYGPNNTFGTNPSFANPVPPGAPSCGSKTGVPNCMASVIANFTPTNIAAMGYGYQIPSSAQVYDPLFPQWLCNVNLPSGLVTMGCLTGP